MKDEKRALAPPFRHGYLLTVDSFISYCKKRGVKTDRKQLEYYDQQNLLVPVAGIYHTVGIYEQQQVNGSTVFREHNGNQKKKRFYHSEGLGIGVPQHTLRYFDLVAQARKPDEMRTKNPKKYCEKFYPAASVFIPWKNLAIKSSNFVEHKNELGKPALLCYSPEQIFPLIDVQNRLQIIIKDAMLFKSEESWVRSGKEIARVFDLDLLSLKNLVQNQYDALKVYYDAEDLWFELIEGESEKFKEKMNNDPYAAEITKTDIDARIRAWQRSDKRGVVKKILAKHEINKDQLRKMAELFIYPAFFKDPNIEIWEIYRERIPLYWINK